MKKQEKKMIIILIIISIVIIGVVAVFKKSKEEQKVIEIAKNDNVVENNQKDEEEKEEQQEEYVQNLDNEIKLNVSTKLNENKQVKGLEVTNIQLTSQNGITTLLTDVTNTSGEDKEETPLTVKLYDKQGKELAKLEGTVEPLKAGATAKLNMSVTADYANAYNFTIE